MGICYLRTNDRLHSLRPAALVMRRLTCRRCSVSTKPDESLVTDADYAADRLIRETIAEAFPADGILSEETADDGSRHTAERVWIVDPIDGTKGFVAGSAEWAIHIALWVAGELVLGVVAAPASGRMVSAIPGQGLWDEQDGVERTLPTDVLAHAPSGQRRSLILSHRQHANPHPALRAFDDYAQVWSHSVGIKVLRLLDGDGQLYLHPQPLSDWDAAAPMALVLAAGGMCTSATGQALASIAAPLVSPAFLATHRPLHARRWTYCVRVTRETRYESPRYDDGLVAAVIWPWVAKSGRSRLSPDEAERIAWYVEDVAHGIERKPTELIYADGSDALLRVARWAQGNQRDGVIVQLPEPIDQRSQRWALLAQGIAQGLVAYSESGQLRLVEEAVAALADDDPFFLLLEPALRQENIDRVRTSQVVIGLTGVQQDLRRQLRLVEAFHSVRRQHAVDAGGKLWTEPLPSSSPDEPTPSVHRPRDSRLGGILNRWFRRGHQLPHHR